jgi:hypothetical protein
LLSELRAAEGDGVWAEADDVAICVVEVQLIFMRGRANTEHREEAVDVGEAGEEGSRDAGREKSVVAEEGEEDENGWDVEEKRK